MKLLDVVVVTWRIVVADGLFVVVSMSPCLHTVVGSMVVVAGVFVVAESWAVVGSMVVVAGVFVVAESWVVVGSMVVVAGVFVVVESWTVVSSMVVEAALHSHVGGHTCKHCEYHWLSLKQLKPAWHSNWLCQVWPFNMIWKKTLTINLAFATLNWLFTSTLSINW